MLGEVSESGILGKDYITAIRGLVTNVEETLLYNPSGITLCIGTEGTVKELGPLETIRL